MIKCQGYCVHQGKTISPRFFPSSLLGIIPTAGCTTLSQVGHTSVSNFCMYSHNTPLSKMRNFQNFRLRSGHFTFSIENHIIYTFPRIKNWKKKKTRTKRKKKINENRCVRMSQRELGGF